MDARSLPFRALPFIAVIAITLTGVLAPAVSAGVAPDVRNLEVKPASFKALATGGPVSLKGGGLVAFDLRDGAQVTFTFRSVKSGRREGGKCKPGTAKSVKKRCEILGPVPGTMLYVAFSGHNEFRFSGRLDTGQLKPGSYRLVAKAAGTAARSSFTTFKIIK